MPHLWSDLIIVGEAIYSVYWLDGWYAISNKHDAYAH